jgi:hypothetical protein
MVYASPGTDTSTDPEAHEKNQSDHTLTARVPVTATRIKAITL